MTVSSFVCVRRPRLVRVLPVQILLGLLLLGGIGSAVLPVQAQSVTRTGGGTYQVIYRPSDATYRVESWPHGKLIYQTGSEETAHLIAATLNESDAGTDELIPTAPSEYTVPVVVNGYNDRSNGYVTPLPFKQEIEAVAIKQDELVGRFTSWPAVVATHEQVHATHAEVAPGFGVGGVVRWFAPDVARSINLFGPGGFTEGIAVYRESQVQPGAGRLNAPLFHMKMRAALLSYDETWSYTRMMEAPNYTRPFDRHYIGGGHLTEYLALRDGTEDAEFFNRAANWHNRFPFLTHGIWMWAATGQTPTGLGREVRSELRARYQAQQDALGPLSRSVSLSGKEGAVHRRPYWINEHEVVTYASGYDVRPGLYVFGTHNALSRPVRVQAMTEDRTYSLSRDSTSVLTSRYVPDSWVPTQALADVERVDLTTGAATRLTRDARILAPVELPDGRLAGIQNDGAFTQWVTMNADGTVQARTSYERLRLRQIAVSPSGDRIAVLLNVNGKQHLYRATLTASGQPELRPWLGLDGALIYDVSWGPDGQYLLFGADTPVVSTTSEDDGADFPGIVNVHAYDTRSGDVLRLTNTPFGAFEPALSPRQDYLAYVEYQHERHDLVTLPFEPDAGTPVADSLVLRDKAAGLALRMSSPPPPVERPEPELYQAFRYLRPRTVAPYLTGDADELDANLGTELGLGVGVVLTGADPLQRWAYEAIGYWQDGRMWGEATVQTGKYLLRPSLTLYNEAETRSFLDLDQRVPVAVGFEERGAVLGVELPIILQQNAYLSVLNLSLDSEYRQTRFFGETLPRVTSDPDGARAFRDRATVTPTAAIGLGLQQNVRDFVPNTGFVFTAIAESDVWTDGVTASNAFYGEASAFLPWLRGTNTGLAVRSGYLWKDDRSVFNFDRAVPRGYEDVALRPGSYLRFDAEVTQPVWFPDDGISLLPIYLRAMGLYGFGQTMLPLGTGGTQRLSSVGGGVELRMRFFHLANLNLRIGGAYRFALEDSEWVFR